MEVNPATLEYNLLEERVKYANLLAMADKMYKALIVSSDIFLGTSRRLEEYAKPHSEVDWAKRNAEDVAEEYFRKRKP